MKSNIWIKVYLLLVQRGMFLVWRTFKRKFFTRLGWNRTNIENIKINEREKGHCKYILSLLYGDSPPSNNILATMDLLKDFKLMSLVVNLCTNRSLNFSLRSYKIYQSIFKFQMTILIKICDLNFEEWPKWFDIVPFEVLCANLPQFNPINLMID